MIVYSGTTTLYAKVLAVGPATASVRLHGGNVLWITLAAGVADALAGRVGQTVGFVGTATWNAETRAVVSFEADRLSPYRDRDPGMDRPRTNIEAFAALAEAAGSRWDDVDPDEFVRDLRAD